MAGISFRKCTAGWVWHLLAIWLIVAGAVQAQTPFKFYPTAEAYCADNPKAPTCVKPIKTLDLRPVPPYKIPGLGAPRRTPAAPPPVATLPSLNLRPDWRFAHPRSDITAGINLASLRQSPGLRALLAELTDKLHLNPDDVQNALTQTNDIDQVWLSMRGNDTLLLLQGRMRLPDGFIQLPNGMTSYRISPTAVVLGREGSVADAVQRLWRSAPAPAVAVQQAKQLAANTDLWMVANHALLGQMHFESLVPHATGFSFALKLREGLSADVRLTYATLAAATRMMAASGRKDPPPTFLQDVTVQQIGTSVRVKLKIPQGELSKALDRALAGPVGQQLSAAVSKSVSTSQGLVIYGGTQQSNQRQSQPIVVPPANKSDDMVIYGLHPDRKSTNVPH